MITSKFNGYNVNLVESLKDMEVIKSNLNSKILVGVDTETTGLSYVDDKIVGVCLSTGKTYSTSDYAGYYLPIRHVSNNLPIKTVIDFVQYILDNYRTCFFNRNYDAFMLENEGVKIPLIGKMHDSQCMAHLVENESYPALKAYCRKYLRWDMIDYTDNLKPGADFSFGNTNPTVSYVYAAGDPLATVMLAKKLWSQYPYIRKIYPIDNRATEAVRRMSKADIDIDYSVVRREYDKEIKHLQEIVSKIYSYVGYQFNLNSNDDKAEALERFMTLTAKTARGKFAVNKEVLSSLDHPLAKMMLEYSTVNKYVGTYLKKMLSYEGSKFRVNYSACNVATGRLSSGGAKNNNYYKNFNMQNVPKVEVQRFIRYDSQLGQVADDKEFECISVNSKVDKNVENTEEESEFIKVSTDNGDLYFALDDNLPIIRDGKQCYCLAKDLKDTDILDLQFVNEQKRS